MPHEPTKPESVEKVSAAWKANAMKAAEDRISFEEQSPEDAKATREFWSERLYVYWDEIRVEEGAVGAWVVCDNYEGCATIMIFYPDIDEWFSMRPWGDEYKMKGGLDEALATAQIIWTG